MTLPNSQGTIAYSYDPVGNRLTKVDNLGTINYTYDLADELLTAGILSFGYDANGNRTTRTNTQNQEVTQYAYDYENRLTQVTLPNTNQWNFEYDPLGRRIGKSTTTPGIPAIKYLWSGAQVTGEYDSLWAPVTSYELGSGWTPLSINDLATATRHYYHSDGQMNVRALTNPAGATTDTYAFDEFGTQLAGGGTTYNPIRYAGQQDDSPVGLVYMRNRYYDPEVGRFINQDPIGFGGGINRYAYVGNNPLGFFDPYGTIIMVQGNDAEIAALNHALDAIEENDPVTYNAVNSSAYTYYLRFEESDDWGKFGIEVYSTGETVGVMSVSSNWFGPQSQTAALSAVVAHELVHAWDNLFRGGPAGQETRSAAEEAMAIMAAQNIFSALGGDLNDPNLPPGFAENMTLSGSGLWRWLQENYPELFNPPSDAAAGAEAFHGKK